MKKKFNALLLTFCILFSVVATVLLVNAVDKDGGTVWEEEYEIIIDNTQNFDISNGTNAQLSLNPRCKYKGVLLEELTPRCVIDVENSYCVNIDKINLSSDGKLTLGSNANPLTDMPAGYIRVNVTCETAEPKSVTVNIVNHDYDNSDLDMYELSAIRINYPDYEEHNIYHTNNNSCYQCLIDMPAENFGAAADDYNPLNTNFASDQIFPDGSDTNTDSLFELIRKSKITVIHTHGSAGSFVINANNTSVQVTSEDILKLPQGYFSESELILCLFSCGGTGNYETSTPSDMSIVEAFAEKGARHVIGFIGTENFANAREFTNSLFEELLASGSYINSCENALRTIYSLYEDDEDDENALVLTNDTALGIDRTIINYTYYSVESQKRLLLMGRGDLNETLPSES